MGIFQNVILNKHIAELEAHEAAKLDGLYSVYSAYFLNLEVQENIRNSNEEQFQEGFLGELFVEILGYTLNPDPDFNLITEKKMLVTQRKPTEQLCIWERLSEL